MHDVPNFDHVDHSIVIDHLEIGDNNQQEFVTRDHEDELKIAKDVFNPIDIELDLAVEVEHQIACNVDIPPVENKTISLESTKVVGSDTSTMEQTKDQSAEDQLKVLQW
ncbi:hypothetical protein J1N35_005041 [Gossypium stocksii]|uniref:Uncharacterized protein n=1 Tax=Gossypium stocksii TaxID=47602 RepID=A0A9D4AIW2_9ROSI|nr:hypothetical protein J1N35_005041 [Gossypium stocksii]